MFPELTVVEEGFPTAVAHEAFVFSVNLHVSLQRPGPRETLPTLVTPEGLLAAVQPQVALVVVLEAEACAAALAAEAFLLSVHGAVLRQAHPGLEGLGAQGALVRPSVRVRQQVDAQVGGGGEAFGAGGAGVGPCPGVHRQVVSQTLPPGEATPTYLAGERAHRQVRKGVGTQRRRRRELTLTLTALQRLLLQTVTRQVRAQPRQVRELLIYRSEVRDR